VRPAGGGDGRLRHGRRERPLRRRPASGEGRAGLALALFIVGDFVAIFSWIAFGPGERHFSTSVGIGGIFVRHGGGETLGRIVFGIGAAMGGAIFLAFLFDG
jgi:hypothetical protein